MLFSEVMETFADHLCLPCFLTDFPWTKQWLHFKMTSVQVQQQVLQLNWMITGHSKLSAKLLDLSQLATILHQHCTVLYMQHTRTLSYSYVITCNAIQVLHSYMITLDKLQLNLAQHWAIATLAAAASECCCLLGLQLLVLCTEGCAHEYFIVKGSSYKAEANKSVDAMVPQQPYHRQS